MKPKNKWLAINRKHRTYWVSEEEDAFIRNYLEENRKRLEENAGKPPVKQVGTYPQYSG